MLSTPHEDKTVKFVTKRLAIAALLLPAAGSLFTSSVYADNEVGPVFELRTYKATPGNMDKLLDRFRQHTMRLFEKHGMTNIGYWVPTDPELAEDTLIYILRHDSQAAADASWRAFGTDPEWQQVNDESNRDGAILGGVVRQYLNATDFSQIQ